MLDFALTSNATNSTNTTAIDFLQAYLYSLPSQAMQGDVAAIAISFMLFFLGIFLINKMTEALLAIIKRTILFFITGIAFYYFLKTFMHRLSLFGLTTENIIFGLFGIVLGLFGLALSFVWLFQSFKYKQAKLKLPTAEEIEAKPEKHEESRGVFQTIKQDLLFKEKNIFTIIIYLVIAEFGIFSSPTKSAPTAEIGLTFFLIFIAATVFFIRKIYKDFKTGLTQFGIALLVGYILSVILGYFWNNNDLSTLLSLQYFATPSLVALITGMAVSLFMSSR
jgi:membrane protease YdiL (CAAX protease family)